MGARRQRRLELGGLLVTMLRLSQSTADKQQSGQARSQRRRLGTAPLVTRCPHERGPDVVDHQVESPPPSIIGLGCSERGDGGSAPLVVTGAHVVEVSCGVELLDAVLADRLQRPVAGRVATVDDEEAVVGEASEAVGYAGALGLAAGDGAGGVDVEP